MKGGNYTHTKEPQAEALSVALILGGEFQFQPVCISSFLCLSDRLSFRRESGRMCVKGDENVDYGFTDAEILLVYTQLKERLKEFKKAKALGQADLAESDIRLYISVIQKIEEKHPDLLKLPM